MKHTMKIGEGKAEVELDFRVSSDGDIEALTVECDGVNIIMALTASQIEDIEAACLDAHLHQAEDDKATAYWANKQECDQ